MYYLISQIVVTHFLSVNKLINHCLSLFLPLCSVTQTLLWKSCLWFCFLKQPLCSLLSCHMKPPGSSRMTVRRRSDAINRKQLSSIAAWIKKNFKSVQTGSGCHQLENLYFQNIWENRRSVFDTEKTHNWRSEDIQENTFYQVPKYSFEVLEYFHFLFYCNAFILQL